MKFEEDEIIQVLKDGRDKEKIKTILSGLSVREAKVLHEKLGSNLQYVSSLEELGKNFEVTRKRIQEIEERALKRLKDKGPDDDGPSVA